jgi:hypothetical protein
MIRHTIYLTPIEVTTQDLDTLGQIRSQRGESFLARSILLARRGEQGVYLWSRASDLNYLFSWDVIRELLVEEEKQGKCAMIGQEEAS